MLHPRLASLARLVRHVRRDETGVISLLTVFVLLGLTMLLLAMINIAKQIDGKVRRQNAVDAATRSAASSIARSMNAIAFANYLEADVFAIASLLYGLEGTETPWTAQYAPLRPLFDQMLAERAVSLFRSEVILRAPDLSQRTMREILRRHGIRQQALEAEQTGGAAGISSSTFQGTVFAEMDNVDATAGAWSLPVEDLEQIPSPRMIEAVQWRDRMARQCLGSWIAELQRALDARQLRMPSGLTTRAWSRLNELLETHFPNANIPALIGAMGADPLQFQFVGFAYGPHVSEVAPRMYRNPVRTNADAVVFAEARVFVPRSRYRWWTGRYVRDDGALVESLGWITRITTPEGTVTESDNRDGWPQAWDTFNQNWTAQLVPATSRKIPAFLSSGQAGRVPNLGATAAEQFQLLNTH